jgi:hypothetical protein
MRKQLLAMTSCVALGFAVSASGPANAIQPTPGLGNAADANIIQVRDRGGFGGGGGGGGQGIGRGSGGGGGAMSFRSSGGGGGGQGISRGNFSAPRGNFQSRGNFSAQGGKFEARGQVQSRSIQSGGNFEPRGDTRSFNKKDFSQKNFDKKDFPRGEVRRGDWDKKDWGNKNWSNKDWDNKKDFSRWKGNRPHLVHRGWDRHHKHRFFGVFLVGVPYGYYAVADHPCYDWVYGPQGWGYYWNYDRCPV